MAEQHGPNRGDGTRAPIPYLTAARPVAELRPFDRDAMVMGVIGVCLGGVIWLPESWLDVLPEMIRFLLVASLVFSLVLNLIGSALAGLMIKRNTGLRAGWVALGLNLAPMFNCAIRLFLA